MLKVIGEHKYLLEFISEDETIIVGKLIDKCPNHRYDRSINLNSICIFEKTNTHGKLIKFNYREKVYFRIHEKAMICYDNLK